MIIFRILLAERYLVHQYTKTSTEVANTKLNHDIPEMVWRKGFPPPYTDFLNVTKNKQVHVVIFMMLVSRRYHFHWYTMASTEVAFANKVKS